MISSKTLGVGVLGIVLVTGVTYAFVAPQFRGDDVAVEREEDSEEVEDGETVVKETETVASDTSDTKVENETEVEKLEQSTTRTPASEVVVPPTPTPTPTKEEPVAPSETSYTRAEVEMHNSASSCWTSINGNVYDLTSYIGRHPGGERNILKICGKDGTALFEDEHGGEPKAETKLASLFIGKLK